MAQENVALVRRFFQAWNDGDLEWILGHLAADFELTTIPGFDLDHVYRGRDGWRSFWELWREPWQRITVRPGPVEDLDGDRLLAVVEFSGVGRQSGAEVSIEVGQIWRLTEGLVSEIQASTPEEALEAAGR